MAIKLIRIQDPSFAVPICTIGRRAFVNDGLQTTLFPPRLLDPTNPEEQYQFRIEWIKKRLITKGAWSIVAVDEEINDENGVMKVLGYAAWYEPDTSAVGNNQPGLDEEDKGWVDDNEGGLRGDGVKHPRCMDFKAHRQIRKLLEESKLTVLGEPAKPAWYLGSLAVDPDFAGRGIATQLVQWGIDKAEEDNIPAFLESTPAAVSLYKRLGFAVVRDLPLDNGHVLTIMVRDSRKMYS